MVIFPDFGRIPGKFHHVIQHHAFLPGYGSGGVVLFQRLNQCFIQGYPTQKLCVRVDSIDAAVGDGNHGGDHFVLAAA